MFDIIIEIPVNIISCQCQTEFTHLPAYSATPRTEGYTAGSGHHLHLERRDASTSTMGAGSSMNHNIGGASRTTTPRYVADLPTLMPMPNGRSSSSDRRSPSVAARAVALDRDVILRTEQFARLVAGQESEAGDAPPAYSSAS